MAIRYIQPGKPSQNAYIERFNRTFREEVLEPHLFARHDDVREAAYWWMLEYNNASPRVSLVARTPVDVRQSAKGAPSKTLSTRGTTRLSSPRAGGMCVGD